MAVKAKPLPIEIPPHKWVPEQHEYNHPFFQEFFAPKLTWMRWKQLEIDGFKILRTQERKRPMHVMETRRAIPENQNMLHTLNAVRTGNHFPITAFTPGKSTAFHTWMVSYKVEDDRMIFDYAIAIGDRDVERQVVLFEDPIPRIWVHVEVVRLPYEDRWVYDNVWTITQNVEYPRWEQNVVGVRADVTRIQTWQTDTMRKYVFPIDNGFNPAAYYRVLLNSGTLPDGAGLFMRNMVRQTTHTILPHCEPRLRELGELGAYARNDHKSGLRLDRELAWIRARNPKEYIYKYLVSQKAVSEEFLNAAPKAFWKLMFETLADVEDNDIRLGRSRGLYWIAVRAVALLEHFDPSILVKFREAVWNVETGYNYAFAHIDKIAGHPLFLRMPLGKRENFAVEMVLDSGGNIYDIERMTNELETRKPGEILKIPAKRIKSLKDLHDEITYLYNELKYELEIIDPEWYKPITMNGLVIDDKYEIVIPEHTNVIRAWGTQQSHCIGSYADHPGKGNGLLVGFRDLASGEWVGHMQINAHKTQMDQAWNATQVSKYTATGNSLSTSTSNNTSGNFYVATSTYLPNAGSLVRQFFGKRNSRVPEEVTLVVTKHLNTSLEMYFEAKKKEETVA